MQNSETQVLALYDFASKQEYIYKTPKIKEISGASELLAGMYETFIKELNKSGIAAAYKGDDNKYIPFDEAAFSSSVHDAQVLYDGGGNLMVLYKSEEIYKEANRLLSVMLLQYYPGMHMISSFVNKTANFSQGKRSDVSRLYSKNREDKNLRPAFDLTGVTPFTQLDPMTFLPVTRKFSEGEKDNPYPTEISLSEDRYVKAAAYKRGKNDTFIDEGLAAVIYIDGNNMGKKLTSLASESYDEGVKNLRFFSEEVQKSFVTVPLKKIKEENIEFRKIIGGGDEITLICRAADALKVVHTYFDSLNASDCVIPRKCEESYFSLVGAKTKEEKDAARKNTSCAGIALIHAKSPFTVAYELAEAACENAKKKAHAVPGNYLDFYYCHAGATADFDTLRDAEQSMTARPYAYAGSGDENTVKLSELEDIAAVLQLAGRANVKALGTAAQKGPTDFAFEVERVNAYLSTKDKTKRISVNDLRTIYDVAEFYDVWFDKEDEGGTEK